MTPQRSVFTRRFHFQTLILLFIYAPSQVLAEPTNEFNLTEVAHGLFVHGGVNVNLDQPPHDDIANIGFIVGDKCVAVIDTGGSVAIGKKLRKALRKITSKPICYVINTHIHYDHVLGNVAFRRDEPETIGHYSLRAAIDANRSFFSEIVCYGARSWSKTRLDHRTVDKR